MVLSGWGPLSSWWLLRLKSRFDGGSCVSHRGWRRRRIRAACAHRSSKLDVTDRRKGLQSPGRAVETGHVEVVTIIDRQR